MTGCFHPAWWHGTILIRLYIEINVNVAEEFSSFYSRKARRLFVSTTNWFATTVVESIHPRYAPVVTENSCLKRRKLELRRITSITTNFASSVANATTRLEHSSLYALAQEPRLAIAVINHVYRLVELIPNRNTYCSYVKYIIGQVRQHISLIV